MLLEAILKYSERAQLTEEAAAIKSAFRVMQTTPKAANEMMDVGRLQGFEVSIFSFILQFFPRYNTSLSLNMRLIQHNILNIISGKNYGARKIITSWSTKCTGLILRNIIGQSRE